MKASDFGGIASEKPLPTMEFWEAVYEGKIRINGDVLEFASSFST